MPDIKLGIDAIARLREKFVPGADQPTLESLQHDCRMLIRLIQQFINEIPQVDWLEDANLQYDLAGYSPTQIDAFKDVQKSTLQQELDNSTEGKGYTIVAFNFVPVPSTAGLKIYRASAFLSPAARRIGGGPGGGQGTTTPGYPPK
jgi:hypothetical protein